MTGESTPRPQRKPPVPRGFPLVTRDVIDFTKKHEEPIPYLYQDSVGVITTGVGFNVDSDPKKAFDLGMYWLGEDDFVSGHRATVEDLRTAYEKIRKVPKGYRADFYKPTKENAFSRVSMKTEDMDYHVERKLLASENELKKKIPRFDEIPYPARRALLDMQYNLGDSEFRSDPEKWPELYKGLDARDWDKVAKESHRYQLSAERNEAVKNLFLEARGQ